MPENENAKLYTGAAIDPPESVAPCAHAYAELDVTTNFTFLRGASHPDELVYTAALLGQRAMAVTDVNTLAGVVRAYQAARKVKGFQLIVGARLVFNDGAPELLVWPTDRGAYARLSRLLTLGRRRAPKGECHLALDDFFNDADGMLAAVVPEWPITPNATIGRLREALGDRLSLAVHLCHGDDDRGRLRAAVDVGKKFSVPLLATNHVHYHHPGRRTLQDVVTCVRHGCAIQAAGYKLFPNAERHLKPPERMHTLFARHPRAIERGLWVASQCRFDLGELKYEYPTESVPAGVAPSKHLRDLTYVGAAERYPEGIPAAVRASLEKELAFICGSKYESYFLTVHDLVRFARSEKILCQGRGSAANSAVCYCLGVTSVDPAKFTLVFERFASKERAEPPDIDVDFEHERREEVIQYVYKKYGRDRAAMTASLITYRGRSAVRDVGKALGFNADVLDELAGKLDWWHRGTLSDEQAREAGVDPADPTIRALIGITSELLGFPRHLSQHVGGMVIARDPLCDLVPIENAAMDDRTVIEWDKDDLDAIGLFKVDILALGMLTCISKSLAMINAGAPPGPPMELHTVPHEVKAVYDMISDADTVGVFQIESRAQMSMLPRLRPREFYDLVIEVAIVRPGPIQGDMVHPYLLRREGKEKVEYERDELRAVLEKTLGVPLFQEQAMRIAMVGAGFSGDEADQLRRAMAAWKRGGGLFHFEKRFIDGMIGNGYSPDFAARCFKQICGFGEYGFPESHAASFAKLVYVSAWVKRFHPAVFVTALLNSQPMGFYAPAQLVRDAREHGVEVRPVDVNSSDWDCTLEPGRSGPPRPCTQGRGVRGEGFFGKPKAIRKDEEPLTPTLSPAYRGEGAEDAHKSTWGTGGPAVRLGMRMIKGMRRDDADRIAAARVRCGTITSIPDLQQAASIDVATLRRLAKADALASFQKNRRAGAWEVIGLSNEPAPLFDGLTHSPPPPPLQPLRDADEVSVDYATTGLSLKRHPVSFVRGELNRWRVSTAADLQDERRFPAGRPVNIAGLVLCRQRPGTASGVVFVTLEDETGVANLIIWATVYERYRRSIRHATLLQANGILQREGQVVHVVPRHLFDRTSLMSGLNQVSRDFH